MSRLAPLLGSGESVGMFWIANSIGDDQRNFWANRKGQPTSSIDITCAARNRDSSEWCQRSPLDIPCENRAEGFGRYTEENLPTRSQRQLFRRYEIDHKLTLLNASLQRTGRRKTLRIINNHYLIIENSESVLQSFWLVQAVRSRGLSMTCLPNHMLRVSSTAETI